MRDRSARPRPALALVFAVGVALLAACLRGGEAPLPEDPEALAAALLACPRGDGPWRKALDRFTRDGSLERLAGVARETASAHPDRWEPSWAVGETSLRAGDGAGARAAFAEALKRAESSGDETGRACAGNRLGGLALLSGDLAEAERYLRQAGEDATRAARRDLYAFVQNNLAGVLRERGRIASARDALEEAISALTELKLLAPARAARLNRAILILELGDAVEAEKALSALHVEAQREGEEETASTAAIVLGNLRLALGDPASARSWLLKLPEGKPPRLDAAAAIGFGRAALAEDKPEEAGRRLGDAVEKATGAGLEDLRVAAETYRAAVDLRRGRARAARERLEPMLEAADRLGEWETGWLIRTVLGKALLAEGRVPKAVGILREAVLRIERPGEHLDPLGEGMRFLRERSGPYAALAAALAMTPGRASHSEILATVEKAHARGLRRVWRGEGEPPKPASLDELRRALPDGTVVLDYLLGEEEGVLLAARRGESKVAILPGRRDLAERVRRWRTALSRPLVAAEARLDPMADIARDLDSGRALTRVLLGPVGEWLPHARALWVVADGDLALLPFAALPAGEVGWAFIGDAIDVAMLPAAGLVEAQARERPPVLVAGDPLPDAAGEVPALRRAREELDGIRSVWGPEDATLLSGAGLTASALGGEFLSRFGTVHLATHAVASTVDPRRCAVFLSRGERLGLDDLSRLPLRSSLVVLSACSSGEGEVVPGEGVVGLSWSLLRAGASGVVVSLWGVEDEAAAALMVSFHRGLRMGHAPARALAEARRETARLKPHPAFWAPFVAVLRPSLQD